LGGSGRDKFHLCSFNYSLLDEYLSVASSRIDDLDTATSFPYEC
jgi:hypothetical protein